MSAKNKPGDTNVTGRLNDGWAYLIRLRDGQVERLCDFDGYDAVLARWLAARKGENGGIVSFSGAHAEPGAPLDGIGARVASEVSGISNYSPAAFGITATLEARLAALTDGVEQLDAAIQGTSGDLSDLIDDLIERKIVDPEKWGEDEDGAEEGDKPVIMPMVMTPLVAQTPAQAQAPAPEPVAPSVEAPGYHGGFEQGDEDE